MRCRRVRNSTISRWSSPMIDTTHDAARRSWVSSANGHGDFPIQNLPLGVFAPGDAAARIGVAIGDSILDLHAASEAGLLKGLAAEEATREPNLNALLGLGRNARGELRSRISGLLDEAGSGRRETSPPMLHE